MFILAFIVILCILMMINNKVKHIASDNNDSYEFDRNSVFILLGLLLLGVSLNFVMKNFMNQYLIVLGIYCAVSSAGIIVANQLRIQKIEERRADIAEIYEILDKILKTKKEDIDYNNVPFKINYDKEDRKRIAAIEIVMENFNDFSDSKITDAVTRLNKHLSHSQWLHKEDKSERKCLFIGRKKPPLLAPFPGSDLRPWNWIPLGIGSNGEVGWNLSVKDDRTMGKSLFRFEDTGQVAGTTKVAKIPQSLTLGSTGGGKAVFVDEVVKVQ